MKSLALDGGLTGSTASRIGSGIGMRSAGTSGTIGLDGYATMRGAPAALPAAPPPNLPGPDRRVRTGSSDAGHSLVSNVRRLGSYLYRSVPSAVGRAK